jgi:hypothetical protein
MLGFGPLAPLRVILALGAMAAAAAPAAAQVAPPAPTAEFRYDPSQLDCATFVERSRGRLDAQTGTRQRRETLTRDGVLRLRARPGPTGIALEAWYDSLTLSRDSPEGRRQPDTDGLLGGRYRGTLTPAGQYAAEARPFVPDEVAEVAELGGVLDDLLPPLPPRALAVGERWADSAGLELRRLPDSLARGRVIRRLALRSRTESDRATVRGDTTGIAARQVTVEDGWLDWDPKAGLLRRVRHIVVETSVPARGPVRQPLRSRLEQDVRVWRAAGKCEPALGGEK